MTVLCFVVEGFCCQTWAGLDSWLSSSLSLWSSGIAGRSQSTHIFQAFFFYSQSIPYQRSLLFYSQTSELGPPGEGGTP